MALFVIVREGSFSLPTRTAPVNSTVSLLDCMLAGVAAMTVGASILPRSGQLRVLAGHFLSSPAWSRCHCMCFWNHFVKSATSLVKCFRSFFQINTMMTKTPIPAMSPAPFKRLQIAYSSGIVSLPYEQTHLPMHMQAFLLTRPPNGFLIGIPRSIVSR